MSETELVDIVAPRSIQADVLREILFAGSRFSFPGIQKKTSTISRYS